MMYYTPEQYVQGIVNAQFTMAHLSVTYWKSFVDGFMDTYEENVRKFNNIEPKKKKGKKS